MERAQIQWETTTDQENFGEPVTYTNVATTLIGQVTINGTAAREGDVVAFYVGDELRGKQAVVVDAGTAWVNAQVHASGGVETAAIKVYEASTGITHDKVGSECRDQARRGRRGPSPSRY